MSAKAVRAGRQANAIFRYSAQWSPQVYEQVSILLCLVSIFLEKLEI